jgi:hypothetical protein
MAEGYLDEARADTDSVQNHLDDHNDIHQWLNAQRHNEAAFHADSDYFSNEDITAYTELDITGNTTWAEKYGILSCAHDTIAANDRGILGKAITSAVAPITLECEVNTFHVGDSTNSQGAGIFFSDGVTATDNAASLEVFGDTSGVVVRLSSGTLTAMTTNEGSVTLAPASFDGPFMGPFHLRLTWDSANTWSAYWSIDRVSWGVVVEGASFTMTPTHIGFAVLDTGQTSICQSNFKNFEVSDADPGSAA